jgi:hypothetical protein
VGSLGCQFSVVSYRWLGDRRSWILERRSSMMRRPICSHPLRDWRLKTDCCELRAEPRKSGTGRKHDG